MIGTISTLLLLGAIAFLGFQWQAAHYRAKLAEQEQRVRDAGEPLDGADLNAWYKIPEGDADLRPLYVAALAPLADSKQGPDPKGVPYFDTESDTIPLPGEVWDDMAVSEAFLAKHEQTWSLLLHATQQEGSVRYPLDFRQGIAMRLDYLNQLRAAVRLCCLRAAILSRKGDCKGVADSMIASLRLAESVRDEPLLNSQLFRIGAHETIGDLIVLVVSDGKLPLEQFKRLQTEFAHIDRESASRIALLGERAGYGYQVMLSTIDEVRGEARELNGATNRPLREIRPGDCALLLELLTDSVEASEGKYPYIWKQQQEISRKVDFIFAEDTNRFAWNRDELTKMFFVPAHYVVFAAFTRGVAQHRCTLVLLAAEQYRRVEGQYPKQLSDLAPGYLAELPTDPYTGEPLRMVQTSERFIIYSVGKNEQDDGGDVSYVGRQALDTGSAVPPFRAEPDVSP